MENLQWGLYLICPVLLAALILAGKKYAGETGADGSGLDRAAALLYGILRKRGPFPGERDVYRAQILLDAPMGAEERTRQWYIGKIRTLLLFFLAADLIAAAVHLSAVTGRQLRAGGVIERNTYGGADKEVDLEAALGSPGEKETECLGDYHLKVQARRYTGEETEAMAQEVMEKLPALILGDNEGPDRVWKDLHLPGALEGYPFRIGWKSSFYGLLDTDGRVLWENLSDPGGEEVTLTAVLTYAPWTFEKDIPLRVVKPPETEPLSRRDALEALLEEEEAQSLSGTEMVLADTFEGKRLVWREKTRDSSAAAFLAVALAGAAGFFLGDRDLKKKLEERNRQLILDYPGLASRFALYLGAGMSVRNVFFRLGREYEAERTGGADLRYAGEEILLICHELESGVSEKDAYEHWGKRCRLQQYVRLSSLLGQNLRKGNKALLSSLQEEAAAAAQSRRTTAKKLGEEAGTKLLLPMAMMLAVTMLIIIVPACFGFM